MNVLVEQNGPVTTVIINRPERRNAVNEETAEELLEAFKTFERDEASAVAVLTGAGGHFCAGWDLKAFATEGFPDSYDPEGDGGHDDEGLDVGAQRDRQQRVDHQQRHATGERPVPVAPGQGRYGQEFRACFVRRQGIHAGPRPGSDRRLTTGGSLYRSLSRTEAVLGC